MRSERATAPKQPPAPPVPDEGYRALTVAEVLSDLGSLDTEQLLLVKALEEAGERRPVILARIEDLLVVQEASHHLCVVPDPIADSVVPNPVVPNSVVPNSVVPNSVIPTSGAPAPVEQPKVVSTDLVDQMGGLLAKDAARRSSSGLQTAWPMPDLGQGGDAGDVPATNPATPFWPADNGRRGRKHKGAGKNRHAADPVTAPVAVPAAAPTPVQPGGFIVPTDGRRSRRGGGHRLLALVLLVALLAAGGFLYWKHTEKASVARPVTLNPLTALLVKAVPAGFTLQPDSVGDTGPSDLAKAVKDDGAAGAQAALVQDGFLAGYQRLWSTTGDQQIIVFLYEFRTGSGATAYGQRMVTASKANKPVPSAFAVTSIPGAVGLSGGDSSGKTAQIVFARRNYLVGVVTDAPGATNLTTLDQQIAAAQYALLPAN